MQPSIITSISLASLFYSAPTINDIPSVWYIIAGFAWHNVGQMGVSLGSIFISYRSFIAFIISWRYQSIARRYSPPEWKRHYFTKLLCCRNGRWATARIRSRCDDKRICDGQHISTDGRVKCIGHFAPFSSSLAVGLWSFAYLDISNRQIFSRADFTKKK